MSANKFVGILVTPENKVLGSEELTKWNVKTIWSEKALHEHFSSVNASPYDFFINKGNTESELKILQSVGKHLETISLIGYKEVRDYFKKNIECFVFFK